MKFTLNNFYSNNYKDFIHLEALKNVLRKVPQLKLAGVENIDNALSMEFSVDDWGENPMYIKYIDTDNKEHIVKIKPSVTEQIYEILKAYAKISYVDEQDKKLKDELHTEIAQGDESTLNGSKAYTDTVVNHAKDEINHTIETTKQDLKDYCDNKCEVTLTSSKEYTDTKAHEISRRIDDWTTSLNGKIETINQLVTANDNKTTQALADVNSRIDNQVNSLNEKIETGNAETLEASKNYTDTQLGGYETKGDAKAEHDKLSTEVENANKVYGYDTITNSWEKSNGSFTVFYNNSNITKLGYCQTNGEVEKGVDFTKLATNEKVETINQLVTANFTQKINEVSKKVDDLDIGGTNLLWGTDTYVNADWTLAVSEGISHGERQYDGLLSQSIHIWGDDNKAKENMATYWLPIHLIAGHQYTISLQARYYEPNRADTKVTGRNIRVFSDYTDAHEPEGFGLTTELTGEYKRYSHTFTCKQTGDYRGWRFGDWIDAVGYPGGSIYIGEIKIEEGNKPTAWRTAEGELASRLRGTVENVPKEFFMSLNNTVLDTNSCYARLFRFTDFAIVKIGCNIKGVTIDPWTYRDVVSAPMAYFKGFSKFDYIKGKKEFSDLGRPYEVDFNITNSNIGIYCRGTKIEKEGLSLEITGILYN